MTFKIFYSFIIGSLFCFSSSVFCIPHPKDTLKAALFTFFHKNEAERCDECNKEDAIPTPNCLPCKYAKEEHPRTVEFSADGKKLIVKMQPSRTYIYGVENNKDPLSLERIIDIEGQQILHAKLAPASSNDRLLTLATDTGYIYFYNLNQDDSFPSILPVHTKAIHDIDFSDNGNYLASISSDKTINVLSLDKPPLSGEEIMSMQINTNEGSLGRKIKFGRDNKFAIQNGHNFAQLYKITTEGQADIKAVDIYHIDKSGDNRVYTIDKNGVHKRCNDSDRLSDLAFSKDGKHLTQAWQGNNVHLHNLVNKETYVFETTGNQRMNGMRKDVAFSNDSSKIAVSGSDPDEGGHCLDNNHHQTRIYDLKKDNPTSKRALIQTIEHIRGPKDHWWNKHNLPEGFDWDNDTLPEELVSQKYKQVTHITFSHNDEFLATGDDNSEVKLFQRNPDGNYSLVYTTRNNESADEASCFGINDLAFNGKNRMLAIASEDKLRLLTWK